MKNNYETPAIEIAFLDECDVIRTSQTGMTPGGSLPTTGGNSTTW